MLFSENDIKHSTEIVAELLKSNLEEINDAMLRVITIDIMNISYSKGGDYSAKVIRAFAETYIENKFHENFIS